MGRAKESKSNGGGDVYGQVHPEESEEFIGRKLREFDDLLGKIPATERANVCEAEARCPELLTPSFKLMFLRCDVFQVDLAVKRFVKYWNKRLDAFGPEKAFLPLTQDGALRDDSYAMHCGFFRLTGTKGAGGRQIVYCDPTLQDFNYTKESMLRSIWYLFHAALEDEDTQKKGFIFIVFPYNATLSHMDSKLSKLIVSNVQGCLPVRLSGLHFCRPPLMLSTVFPIVKTLLGKRLEKRIRVHSGSNPQAGLDKYGLFEDVLPDDIGGTVVLDHAKWLADRRRIGK